MQRNANLKAPAAAPIPARWIFCPVIPRPRPRENALANARQFSSPGPGERDRSEYLSNLDGMVYGEDPSEGFARGRHFLHPKLGLRLSRRQASRSTNTAQAVLDLRRAAAKPCVSMWWPCRPSSLCRIT
jgi:predicted Zn-dependent protease